MSENSEASDLTARGRRIAEAARELCRDVNERDGRVSTYANGKIIVIVLGDRALFVEQLPEADVLTYHKIERRVVNDETAETETWSVEYEGLRERWEPTSRAPSAEAWKSIERFVFLVTGGGNPERIESLAEAEGARDG